MTDDERFVAAVAADPADPGPRAAYADWLLERDDPRAAYLQAEAAGANLAALSRLAVSLDLGWLAAVSRVSADVRRTWAGVASGPTARRRRPPPTDPVGKATAAVGTLRDTVNYLFLPDVARRLAVPADYLGFLAADGGEWRVGLGTVYGAVGLADRFEQFWARAEAMTDPRPDGLWLPVADSGDGIGYYLSADAGHPMAGMVIEYDWRDGEAEDEDESLLPWAAEPPFHRLAAETWTEYLRGL